MPVGQLPSAARAIFRAKRQREAEQEVGPREIMKPETPDADRPEDYTVLKDSGLGCAFILGGWIPPLVAAGVSGVIVALRTGSLGDLAQVLIGGTVAGYVASLIILFTVGHLLERRGVGARVANAFLYLVFAIGVAAAIAVAALVDSGRSEV